MLIRPAKIQDLEAIAEFTRETWGPGSGDFVPERFPAWLEEESGIVLVADLDGRAVGVVHGEDQGHGELWCEGMRVDAAHRGQGIATRLQTELNRQARERRFRTSRLATGYWNTAAHRSAAQSGFHLALTVTGWTAEPAAARELPVMKTPPPLDPDALIGLDGWHFVSGRNFKPERIKPDQAFLGEPAAWALVRVRERAEWKGPGLVIGQVGGQRNRYPELLAALRGHAAARECTVIRLWWPKGDLLPAPAGYQIILDEDDPNQPYDVLVFEARAER